MNYGTPQEIFNKAVAGLAAQGFERAMDANDQCMYLGWDGKRCAVGHLIPDGHPGLGFEGGYASLVLLFPDLADPANEFFLRDLQHAHDVSNNPEDMRERLKDVARKYGLVRPEVLNVAKAVQ